MTIPNEGGKQQRRYFYASTQNQVRIKLQAFLREVDRGLLARDDRLTVGEYLGDWLNYVKATRSAQTYKQYRSYVDNHIKPPLGHLRLSRLAPGDVQRLMLRKQEEGLAPRTVELVRAILRAALTRSERWELVSRDVAKLVEGPRQRPHDPSFLSPEAAAQLVERLTGDRLWAAYVVAIGLGLRSGELRALRWADIDFEQRELRVAGNMQRIDGQLVRTDPKTRSSRRVLPLPEFVADALTVHRGRQDDERALYRTRWQEHDLVFTTTIGTPLDGSSLTHKFQAALAKAGLPKVRLHDLRHTCATLLASKGVDARTAMEFLGHSQISVTMNIYTHVLPESRREAAKRMDSVFQSVDIWSSRGSRDVA